VAPRGGAVALPAPGGVALGLIGALGGISKHRWLDRLIHGRAWIALVAFALIGIVAMQLWVVKLGVGIGRALEHEGLLQRENATLSIEDARLSSGERVEQLAAARGMVVAPPGALRFDTSRGALDGRLAAAALARGGQAKASSSSSSATTATSGAEAAASSTETSTSTATTTAGATSTESAESSTATSAGSTAAASTPEGTSGGEDAATTPTTEGATGETGTDAAPAAGGGSAAGESATVAPAEAVGADGGTQQPTPGG
jgi:cell division protein FtsL